MTDPVDARPIHTFEVLALDERSGDNTLALLSVLHGRVPELRTLQDVEPGSALMRATAVARGRVWVLVDHPIPAELLRWGVTQVPRGHRAAIVPGELLVVDREVGITALARLRGGLVSAQRAVERVLQRRSERPAFSPPPDRGLMGRAVLELRSRLAGVGLGRLDRPLGPAGDGLL